jgi:hypothetical protein
MRNTNSIDQSAQSTGAEENPEHPSLTSSPPGLPSLLDTPLPELYEAIEKCEAPALLDCVSTLSKEVPALLIPEGLESLSLPELRIAVGGLVSSPESVKWRKQHQPFVWKPEIDTGIAADYEMSDQALTAIRAVNNPPHIFARATQLVRVAQDEKGDFYIQPLEEAGLAGILDRLITWYRITSKGEKRQDRPPKTVVRDILALPASLWGVPPLAGVTRSPIFHADGSLHAVEGYDPETMLYYQPDERFTLPSIPDQPDRKDVAAALATIDEVFCDFPFVDAADRANAYGALLTAVLRPCIDGPVPLYVVDKPQAGAGAGLLQRAIGRIATGREPPLKTMPVGEAMRKEIFASLKGGTRIQIFDNIEDRLSSPELAAVLTAPSYTGRILGRSEELTLDVACFWMANGNNIQIGGDLARRIFRSRIDPQVAYPWQREGFKHEDLLAWVDLERGRILAAVYTLARAWVQAGSPAPEGVPRVGSFERWRDTIGGILEHAGVQDFMGNADSVYLEGDADRMQWEAFLSALWDRYGAEPLTAGGVNRFLKHNDGPQRDAIFNALPDSVAEEWGGKKSFSRVLGNAFAKQDGRHFPGGWCIRRGKVEHHAQSWVITYAPPEQGQGSYGGVSDLPDTDTNHEIHDYTVSARDGGELGELSYNPHAREKNSTDNTRIERECTLTPLTPREDQEERDAHPDEVTEKGNTANTNSPITPPNSPLLPLPGEGWWHPSISEYEPRSFDEGSLCMVPGCRHPPKYGARAGFGLCESHYRLLVKREGPDNPADEGRDA